MITADCFPVPDLLLRTNDPAAQHTVRTFAHQQAEAARSLHQALTTALRAARDIAGADKSSGQVRSLIVAGRPSA
ncbi:hypothetical protein, partial [Streptomyces sp. NPDC002346]